MTRMMQEQLMEVLKNRIGRYEKDWNVLKQIGDQRGADILDGRQKEAQDLLWMLEDIKLTER